MKLTLLSLFLAASCLSASPVLTYTFTGTASGSIGGTNFTGVSLSVFASADATSASCTAGTCFQNLPGGGASFTLGGIGSGVFNGDTYFFDNQNFATAGFGDNTAIHCCDIIQLGAPVFGTYDLTTPIGPIGPGASNPSVGDWVDLNTSLGAFTVTQFTNYTFQATVADTATPEPSTLFLLAAGLGLMAVGTQRKFPR
jgi:hypothetical protein